MDIRRNQGFTLIEMVVATAVFAVVLSAIAGSYLSVLRLNEKSRTVRVVEQNARFITEFLTREIRNGTIDFSAAGYNGSVPNNGMVTYLYLLNSTGARETLDFVGTNIRLTKGSASTNLSGSDVRVSNLVFYVYPSNQSSQNTVGFSFKVTSNTTAQTPGRESSVVIQSTIATRDY